MMAHGQVKPLASSFSDNEGILTPHKDIDVATTELGIIRELLVKPGDRVVAGQPIAVLDSEVLKAQIRVKETESAAKGRLDQAHAEVALQEKRLAKLNEMRSTGSINSLELERAETDLMIVRGRLRAEQDQVLVQEAELERIKTLLHERTILAPDDGIITEVFKSIGEFVATNSPNIVRLIDNRKLKATFSLREDELHSMKVGDLMRIQLGNGKVVDGVVDFVPPVADAATGWFMVTVMIDNADGKIIASKCQRIP